MAKNKLFDFGKIGKKNHAKANGANRGVPELKRPLPALMQEKIRGAVLPRLDSISKKYAEMDPNKVSAECGAWTRLMLDVKVGKDGLSLVVPAGVKIPELLERRHGFAKDGHTVSTLVDLALAGRALGLAPFNGMALPRSLVPRKDAIKRILRSL